MAFDWNNTGQAPAVDEFEISIIGPGFGECTIIHLGNGRWIVVDSCIDPTDIKSGIPVAERYLRHIGVQMDAAVDLIVATHWHDDHVRGMGRLLDACTSAKFSCANSLLKAEFATYLLALSTGSAATDGAKVREFLHVLRTLAARGTPIRYATGSRTLESWSSAELGGLPSCTIKSLSPSDKEFHLFLETIAQATPKPNESKRSASRQTPNLSSVVLHIDAGPFAIVLGADMEIHHDAERGWNSAIREATVSQAQKAFFYKVAHHGSSNGHHDEVWTTLLHPTPICVVTPFNRLPDARKLPTQADLTRIQQQGRVFLTSPRITRKPVAKDQAVIRSLRESSIVIRDLSSDVGMVRFRKTNTETMWRSEVFPAAAELGKAAAA